MTVFSHLLRTVPQECSTLLTSLVTSNHLSLSASNLQLKLSFRLWQREIQETESDGLSRFVDSLNFPLLLINDILGSLPATKWTFSSIR